VNRESPKPPDSLAPPAPRQLGPFTPQTSRIIVAGVCVAVMLAYAEFIRHALKYAYPPSDLTKGDFLAFYEAARDMVHGGDIHAIRARNYIYPPLVAMLYMPLTLLDDPATSHRAAAIIALLTSALMSIATAWMLARAACERLALKGLGQSPPIVALVAAASIAIVGDKIRSELRMWQTDALMLFIMAFGVRWLDRRPWLAGLALGVAVNVKYLPIFFLPWLLVRRRFQAAGGMVAGILAGAFAPALWVGWSKNLEYLQVGFGGLLALVGIDPGGQHAVTEDIAGTLSVSITSTLARHLGGPEHAHAALAISGVIALLVCVGIAFMYRRANLPLLAWPRASQQLTGPFPALIAVEMGALIIGLLVFSPQTNPRHLYLLLIPASAAAAMIIAPAASRVREIAIAGVALLIAALVLPPGGTRLLDAAVHAWREGGGPSLGMLALLCALVLAGTRTARSESVGVAQIRR
jgi:hypothetical protein